ncbi:hypothetical protein BT96DRAFT_196552 [Gymnopus androsaceus JB14]|uniref:Uncharacterized protein n=1 Tax=Gymnopus androsaceus JB14 TaxID=1447944 RepID=A0A6A4HA93_9AGAR|nr:hypothetical protein BT96DRAFT_196552 [Gymnopus androsaceus JB14]
MLPIFPYRVEHSSLFQLMKKKRFKNGLMHLIVPQTRVADDKRAEGTGEWILNHPEYVKWKQSSGALWIQGKAGSGKTILSTTIIRNLQQAAPENLWYHYFDSRDNTGQKTDLRGCLQSILLQAGANREGIHSALKDLFDNCTRQGLTGYPPTTKDLTTTVMEIFETIGRGYIVLDAMDECRETVEVLEWVQSLPTKLSLLFTSRNNPGGNTWRECFKISLNGQNAKVDQDITTYLEKEIKKCKFKGDLRTEVMNTLKEKAEGQFRWVDCQLKALASCASAKIARKALKDLPEDLEQTYIKAIKWTWESRNREDAHHVLLWLTYAFKPLTVREVGDILAIDFERNCVDSSNEMEVQINLIIDSTLVSVDMNSNVQLAHASVKEFMINQQNSAQTVRLFKINELLAHEKIGCKM